MRGTPGNNQVDTIRALLAATSAMGGAVQASAPITSFVFRPGGVAAKNVYTSWPALVTAANTVAGEVEIFFDDTFAPITIPAGTWTLNTSIWYGSVVSGGGVTIINFDDGAHLAGVHSLMVYFAALVSNSASPVITYTGGNGGLVTLFESALFSFAAGPFIHATSTAGIGTLAGIQNGQIGDGANSIYLADAGGGGQNVELSNHSTLFSNALSGTAAISVVFDSDSPVQSPQGGAVVLSPQSAALQTTYNAALVGDWSGTNPTSVKNALDRIAAKITPIP